MNVAVRLIVGAVLATALTISSLLAPASAAPGWEINFARNLDGIKDPLFLRCGPVAWYGGRGAADPAYEACFVNDGDHLIPRDLRSDGDAAVMKWVLYKYVGGSQKYSSTITRRGVCIYTGGSRPGHRSGDCNKDLPERAYLIIRAGKRIVSGSTRLRDMRFGGPTCITISGNSSFLDENCLFAPATP